MPVLRGGGVMPDSEPRLLFTTCIVQGHFTNGSTSRTSLIIRFTNLTISHHDDTVLLVGQITTDTPEVA